MSKTKPVAMPICELCDRMTIARLKYHRLADDEIDKQSLQKQIEYYDAGIDQGNAQLGFLIVDLEHINGKIWDAEHAIRRGIDEQLGLEEIGRRALRIRDLNRERIALKNKITELADQPEFSDCKMNHASS